MGRRSVRRVPAVVDSSHEARRSPCRRRPSRALRAGRALGQRGAAGRRSRRRGAACWSPSTLRPSPSNTPHGAAARCCSSIIRSCATPSRRSRPTTIPASLILRAAREGVALVAAHTNLDKAHGGLADIVCGALGLEGTTAARAGPHGLVQAGRLRARRRSRRGAHGDLRGRRRPIGDYMHCSFSAPGEGTFEPGPRAHPSIGEVGQGAAQRRAAPRGRVPAGAAPRRDRRVRRGALLRRAGLRPLSRRRRGPHAGPRAGSATWPRRARSKTSPPRWPGCSACRPSASPATVRG